MRMRFTCDIKSFDVGSASDFLVVSREDSKAGKMKVVFW